MGFCRYRYVPGCCRKAEPESDTSESLFPPFKLNNASTETRTKGFNEPDSQSESNVDPTTAAQLWMQHIEPLKALGVRLGGPSVTGSPTGKPWLDAFFAACKTCTIDFLPLHWYVTFV